MVKASIHGLLLDGWPSSDR